MVNILTIFNIFLSQYFCTIFNCGYNIINVDAKQLLICDNRLQFVGLCSNILSLFKSCFLCVLCPNRCCIVRDWSTDTLYVVINVMVDSVKCWWDIQGNSYCSLMFLLKPFAISVVNYNKDEVSFNSKSMLMISKMQMVI